MKKDKDENIERGSQTMLNTKTETETKIITEIERDERRQRQRQNIKTQTEREEEPRRPTNQNIKNTKRKQIRKHKEKTLHIAALNFISLFKEPLSS